jgi:hypothetical protein
MLLALFLIACPLADDTGDSVVEPEDVIPEVAVCEPAVLEFDGPEAPKVGEVWKFWLTCDDVLQMGASRPSIEPITAGSIVDGASTPEVTWLEAGEATLTIQTGRFKADRVVTVLAGS